MSNYYFDKKGMFVVEDYDKVKTFSSFLPGIAGVKGIPMWTFYVNRGQAICSFGIRDKNSAIMEFSPANTSYKTVSTNGFRTFLKDRQSGLVYEPFSSYDDNANINRYMYISADSLIIQEVNQTIGIDMTVTYFTIPNDDYAGLVRQVEVQNISDRDLDIEILDGMPELLPYGVENAAYKSVGNLLKSWMEVYNIENSIPYYRVRASTADHAQVDRVTKGHFYLSFSDQGTLLTPIVDANLIFGYNTSLREPENFMREGVKEILEREQITANKVPCAFSGMAQKLARGESMYIYTIVGHATSVEFINEKAERIANPCYISTKRKEMQSLVEGLTDDIHTSTSSEVFDAYARQCYLDNLLRGGYPLILDNGKEGFVYHVYSRKHGDLERDYNFFVTAPEYYSQGNGNFRDVNQNRRNDVFFHPKAGIFNIKTFMNLIQLDGYNPLSVEGCTFEILDEKKEEAHAILDRYILNLNHRKKLIAMLDGKYTPGQIANYIGHSKVELSISDDEFLMKLLSLSKQNIEASYAEGFWIDHWTYNMDLIENYLAVYPDRFHELLFGDHSYKFFDSPVYVLPRSQKYVLTKNGPRQYGAVVQDEEKIKQLGIDIESTNWVKTKYGKGSIYNTNLFTKLLCLSLVKFATLDPFGMGVEMEAGKPGWNDAMNGLPGVFGSGMSETFELKRIIKFILKATQNCPQDKIGLPIEVYELFAGVSDCLDAYYKGEIDDFMYWDQVSSLRETYRASIRFGIDGSEEFVWLDDIQDVWNMFERKLEEGIERSLEYGEGIYPTYFCYEAIEYDVIKDGEGKPDFNPYSLPRVDIKAFKPVALPRFLEGVARALKTIDDSSQASKLYRRVKDSYIFDRELKMYKTSESLNETSYEIGRARAFTPGWLERESVFLHMSYKYLLEILRSGLYDEFFEEIRTGLIPFLDPKVYGRSTLENCSFIASSVNPDKNVWGQGFVARMSGSNAEFISMWQYMMMGDKPFRMEDGKLCLILSPILPGWLFDEEGKITFKFLKSVVTYYNPSRKNTYGVDRAVITKIKITDEDGEIIELEGDIIACPYAEQIREGRMRYIDVYMI